MKITFFNRCFLFIAILMSCFLATQAQVTKRDVVYLKNGSIIKGSILEMVPGGSLKIETADGSIFIYKMDEVEKTTKEEVALINDVKKEVNKEDLEDTFNPRGYFISASIGPNLRPDAGEIEYAFTLINGIQINEYLSFGIGIKPTTFTLEGGQSTNILPVFFDARFYIPKRRIHPMFTFQFGYTVIGKTNIDTPNNSYIDFVPNSNSGGIFMAVGSGMRVFINKRFSIMAEGGFNIQTLNGKTYSSYYSTNTNNYYASSDTKETNIAMKLNFGIAVNLGK